MAFWGVEIGPGKPHIHMHTSVFGRLRVSKATLGTTESNEKAIVVCKVGEKKPVYLCSLLPRKKENCTLNAEFEELEEVTFSVKGPHSIHLFGFYYGPEMHDFEEGYPVSEEIDSDEDELIDDAYFSDSKDGKRKKEEEASDKSAKRKKDDYATTDVHSSRAAKVEEPTSEKRSKESKKAKAKVKKKTKKAKDAA